MKLFIAWLAEKERILTELIGDNYMNEQMTEKQGGGIHFKLHNLRYIGVKEDDLIAFNNLNADRKFTKIEASDLIDWLIIISEMPKTSDTFQYAKKRLLDFIQSKINVNTATVTCSTCNRLTEDWFEHDQFIICENCRKRLLKEISNLPSKTIRRDGNCDEYLNEK